MTPNYFENKCWSLIELVAAINRRKHKPGQVGSLGIFRTRGARSTKIAVEERGSAVTLIQTSERGAPATQYTAPKRTARLTKIPYIKVESTIFAHELEELRRFGTEDQQVMLEEIRDEHLNDMGDSVDVTKEHMLLGALKGKLVDADGTTTILDLYDFFEQQKPAEVDCNLDSATEGEVTEIFGDLIRSILDSLGSDAAMVSHIQVLGHSGYIKALKKSVDYRASVRFDGASEALRTSNIFQPFRWLDIVFEEYRLGNSGLGGSWIETDKAIAFPVGPAIYDLHHAPGTSFADINAPGLPMYAKSARDPKYDEWLELRVESSPIAICTKPEALRVLKKT